MKTESWRRRPVRPDARPGGARADEGPDAAVPADQDKPAAPAEKPWPAIEYVHAAGGSPSARRTSSSSSRIGFNLQTRFTHFDFDPVPNALSDADEFRVRRFKLYFTGYAFDPRLTYRVQLAFENVNNTRLLLDDAWINYKFIGRDLGADGTVEDALQPRRALQRRRHPVPGARPRRGHVQARPRHRRRHPGLPVRRKADVHGRRRSAETARTRCARPTT